MPTKIEWTDETWNPVTGCTKVSQGCKNCYAERHANRMRGRCGYPGDDPFKVTLHHDRLEQPLGWRKPRRVFVCSMGDLFHEDVPAQFIGNIFGVMGRGSQHTFQVLTKRPQRMMRIVGATAPPPNVWLGVSVENQAAADERIPILLQTPAAVRFVSCEPLLGPVDLFGGDPDPRLGGVEAGRGVSLETCWQPGDDPHGPPRPGVDWVIAGGESGPKARPMHPDWVRSLRDQCVAAGVPFLFKQWGEWAPTHDLSCNEDGVRGRPWHNFDPDTSVCRVGKRVAGRQLDGRTWDEFPEVTR